MIVKRLTEHHLEFLSLTGGCIGLSESTLVKMPNCWKSHITAHINCYYEQVVNLLTLASLSSFCKKHNLLTIVNFHSIPFHIEEAIDFSTLLQTGLSMTVRN